MSKEQKTVLTEEEKGAKVLQLNKELLETKARKKASNSAFNDELKRLQAEIVDLIIDKRAPKEEIE